MAENWIHYDMNSVQRVVEKPTGYSIDKNGRMTGLVPGKYAMKFTGLIQAKSGADKWLYITVVASDQLSLDGKGTIGSPYWIKDSHELIKLAELVNKGNSFEDTYFKLEYDINNIEGDFTPIGNAEHPFSGNFDGGGHTIKGISVNTDSYLGLFGYIKNAIINDVHVEDIKLNGYNYCGCIAGYADNCNITNCSSRGSTCAGDCVGSIVGYSGQGTVIQNCFSTVQHTKYQIYGSVGGLVGYNCGSIENSYYLGTINAKIYEKNQTGGIVGYNHVNSSIHYCYFIKHDNAMNSDFDYCGSLNWGDCSDNDSFDVYGKTSSGKYLYTILNSWVNNHCDQGHYRSWTPDTYPLFGKYAQYTETKLSGNGTEESPYIITDAKTLSKFASIVKTGTNNTSIFCKLEENIDLEGHSFEPIGTEEHPFTGHFEGNGKVISNLKIESNKYIGLFGFIKNAQINDVTLDNADVKGETYVGGIAGYSKNSNITNCFTSGDIFGNYAVGAIVGYSEQGTTVQNCHSSMQNTKYQTFGSIGGLIGYNCGTIENCYYSGTINGKIYDKSSTGGVVGYNHPGSAIHYCYFIKYMDVMNGDFDYCGSLNWGECYAVETINLYSVTASGQELYSILNRWVYDNCDKGEYRTWTNSMFPKFSEYANPEDKNETKEYVDLGLPSGLLWATTNVGARHPEEYGNYYAWGETSPKANYDWSSYKYANGSGNSLTKYCSSYSYGDVDYKEVLEEEDDAATANWGKPWRTPTLEETQELVTLCTWSSSMINGINGYKITGPNGNSIFIPAAGVKQYDTTFYTTDACLQSSTIFNASNGKPSSASVLYCEEGETHYWYGWSRCWGYSVRPVTKSDPDAIERLTTKRTQEIIGVYDTSGHKLNGIQKGINIIKYKNGSTKKVVR